MRRRPGLIHLALGMRSLDYTTDACVGAIAAALPSALRTLDLDLRGNSRITSASEEVLGNARSNVLQVITRGLPNDFSERVVRAVPSRDHLQVHRESSFA